MIEITNTEVFGWQAAIRGMRNPKNSWDRSDSDFYIATQLGERDFGLAEALVKAGPVHSKFMRMIHVQFDVNAPLYWWKEMDTYKVATVRNSCSTMHKIHDKEFTLDDFSCEHLSQYEDDMWLEVSDTSEESKLIFDSVEVLSLVVSALNRARSLYLETKEKKYWWQMIQLLPASYNQRATLDMNYETLRNIYKWRKNHKLDEWHEFCEWIESLPYSELITGGNDSESE